MSRYIDPTSAQFGAMMKMPDEGKIHMLNLIRLNAQAKYEDGRKATGADAYKAYGKESGPIFAGVGGKIIWSGDPKLTLIGPNDETGDENWDVAFIAQYPNAAAFGEMVKNPAYQAIVFHRQAAVANSRLIRMAPREGGGVFGG